MPAAPISVQLYSVRNAMAADMNATLQHLADLGFESAEAFGFDGNVDGYRAALDFSGLALPSGHACLVGKGDVTATFDAAVALGIATVIDPFVEEARWTTRDGVEATAARLNALVAPAADRGLRIGYHNHWWEFDAVEGTSAYDIFTDALDERVVLELDSYWAEVGGQSAPALLERLGSRVSLVHIKDGPVNRDNKQQLPAGAGAAPVQEILAASPGATRVIEFDDYDGDIFEGLTASLAYLKRQL